MARDRRRFTLVFSSILLAYGGVGLYFTWKTHLGLALGPMASALLLAWVVLMTFAPLLVWRWERHGHHDAAIAAAWIGYGWMGLIFLFFWIGLFVDLSEGIARLAGTGRILSARTDLLLVGTLSLLGWVYGFIDALRLRVERVEFRSSKLSAASGPVRIAVISDLHLGAFIGARRLRAMLARLRRLQPDILISAGDLVDGQADRLNAWAPLFADFQPPLGKFAVTGNHEYFVGFEKAREFHELAGFVLLRGSAVEACAGLVIAGVDDPTGRRLGQPAETDEHAALAAGGSKNFKILIKHQPRLDSVADFDLQISGHVHKGQIFPFNLFVRMSFPVATGLTQLDSGQALYVSRGTGTWGPPIRVLAPPEITLIELMPG